MTIEFKLPDVGENIESGDVVAVLVSEGDVIQAGQNVLELETDKAVVEVPCSSAGKITKVHVKVGDKVPVGGLVLTIEATDEAGDAVAQSPPSRERELTGTNAAEQTETPVAESPPSRERKIAGTHTAEQAVAPQTPTAPPAQGEGLRPAPAGPATRKLARELGVDIHAVSGSGPGGRIIADDVRAYVRELSSKPPTACGIPVPPPLPDFSQWGPIERRPMSGIRRKTAENLSLAWHLVPHVTQFDLADITELEAGRKRYGQARADLPGKVTMTVLAVKAIVALLKEFPQFNAGIDVESGEIIYKNYYHIGVAVDTDHGLIVPVIRDVNRKSIRELATELDDLANRARDRKIDLAQLRGGTFTITNLGGIAGTAFTPIINYPEVAILGIARARQEYVMRDGTPTFRLMLPLCLSYDHRLIDGADAARFIRKLTGVLSDPVHLLLEG